MVHVIRSQGFLYHNPDSDLHSIRAVDAEPAVALAGSKPFACLTVRGLKAARVWLQEERSAKGELKQLLAAAVQSERAAEKKLADVSAELEAANARLAKAEATLQVSRDLLEHSYLPSDIPLCEVC